MPSVNEEAVQSNNNQSVNEKETSMFNREMMEEFAAQQGITLEQAEAIAERMFRRAEYRAEYNKRPDRVQARKEYNKRPDRIQARREYNRKRWQQEKALRSFSK